MANRLIAFDTMMLDTADKVILYLWNQFEWSRINTLRVILITYYVIFFLMYGAHITIGTVILFMATSLNGITQEIDNIRLSKQMLNTRAYYMRTSHTGFVFRIILYAMFIALMPLIGVITILIGPSPKSALSAMLYVLFLLMTHTFTPEDPPKRKEKKLDNVKGLVFE